MSRSTTSDEGKRRAKSLFFDYWRQHRLRIKVARIFNTYDRRIHQNDGWIGCNFIVRHSRGSASPSIGSPVRRNRTGQHRVQRPGRGRERGPNERLHHAPIFYLGCLLSPHSGRAVLAVARPDAGAAPPAWPWVMRKPNQRVRQGRGAQFLPGVQWPPVTGVSPRTPLALAMHAIGTR